MSPYCRTPPGKNSVVPLCVYLLIIFIFECPISVKSNQAAAP